MVLATEPKLGSMELMSDVATFRRQLLASGYQELAFTGLHAAATSRVPPAEARPYSRMLLAQAIIEGLTVLTDDPVLAAGQPGLVRYAPQGDVGSREIGI